MKTASLAGAPPHLVEGPVGAAHLDGQSTYELQESNVRLKLTIVNTVGFGDQVNKEERYMLSSSNKTGFFLLQDICLLAVCADLALICRNPCHSS